MLLVKLLIVILLLFIVVSLFSALYFMFTDKGRTKRTVRALTVRISLSIFAFILIMVAIATGLIEPNPRPF